MEHLISRHPFPHKTAEKVQDLFEKNNEQLEKYIERLLWWNSRINLVSRDVSRETVERHIRHSLLLSLLTDFKTEPLVVDAGTGGGLPGIPLAIAHPEKRLVLNDVVTKKSLAVKQMVQALGLKNVTVVNGSIEKAGLREPFLLITKHAFKIGELYDLVSHLPWRKMIFYKGINFEDELSGIGELLKIECHNLSELGDFYSGKALVIVERYESDR